MSKFTPETIDRVRDAADIVEIVSAYSDLRRQGERFVGLCPFHDERTPSFGVKPAEGFYYCFGCEAGGDVFRFVQEKEGLSFPEAVEALAERFGVEIEREDEDPQAEARRRRRGRLGEVLERAASYYVNTLWGDAPAATKSRSYLLERGLGEQVLKDFGIGFAPSVWDSITVRGQQAGFSIDELIAAGLVIKSRKGGYYDVFRARITFPIRDVRGRPLGFGARATTPDQKPKYKNSAEGEIYRKSQTLYGIDRARKAIAQGERAVVVEGYTDVLALHQAGIEETVAVMGTAITPDQLKLLSQYTPEVVLALDADRAGREAMLRAQRVAGSGKLRLLVAAMPEGEDPADLLNEDGGEERFRRILAEAVELPVFHARSILSDADLASPGGRDRALDEVLPVLAGMGETITRQELVSEIADTLQTDPGLVVRRLSTVKPIASGPAPTQPPPLRRAAGSEESEGGPSDADIDGDPGPEDGPPMDASAAGAQNGPAGRAPGPCRTPEARREEAFLAMCIAHPGAGAGYIEKIEEGHLSDAALAALPWLKDHLEAPLEDLPREPEELHAIVTRIALRADDEPGSESVMAQTWLLLERTRIDRQIARLRREGSPDPAEIVKLQRTRAEIADAIARQVG